MERKMVRIFAMLVVLVFSIAAMGGCGGNSGAGGGTKDATASTGTTEPATVQEELKPIKMTASFGIGYPNGSDGPFDDDVAKEITRITGVEIENIPLGESIESRDNKVNIMLASGEYPEILRLPAPGAILDKYIKEGALLPLDELIDKYGPNIKRMYGEQVLKKYKDPNDGKIYYLRSYHGTSKEGFFSMNFKYDLLKQLDPEMAAGYGPITPEKFYELLKAFKAKFPTINGKETIPLSFSIDQKFYDGNLTIIGVLKAAFGIGEFSEDAEHNLKIDIKDPNYVKVLQLLSRLRREKLMDAEWPTLRYQVFAGKISEGHVFAISGAWWETIAMGITPQLEKDGPDGHFYPYAIAAEGVTKVPMSRQSDVGHETITITKNCKNPVRAMQLLDYLATEDADFLVMYGPKGKLWDIEGNERVIKEEYAKELQTDAGAFWKKYKVNIWNIVNGQNGTDGVLETYTYSDGTKMRKMEKVDSGTMRLIDFAKKTLVEAVNTIYDQWPLEGILPEAGSEASTIAQQYVDIRDKEIFKIILEAVDDNDVQERLNKLIEKANSLGIDKYEQYVSEQYKGKLELLK